MISDAYAGVYSMLNPGRRIQEEWRLECWQAVGDLLMGSDPANQVFKHEYDWRLRTCAQMAELKDRHSSASDTRCSYREDLLEAAAFVLRHRRSIRFQELRGTDMAVADPDGEQIEKIKERVANSDAGVCSDDGTAPNWVLLELAASGLLFGFMVAAGAVVGLRSMVRRRTGGA